MSERQAGLRRSLRRVFVLACLLTAAVPGCSGTPRDGAKNGATSKADARKELYTCSMHPFIVKEGPGICSICGMTLVKKSSLGPSDRDVRVLGPVALSPAQQVVANLATAVVEEKSLSNAVIAPGTVTYDQTRQGKVAAWVGGRIDRLLVNAVGQSVRKDRPVAELYSAELKYAEEEYLLTHQVARQFTNSPNNFYSYAKSADESYIPTLQRLKLLGFRDQQFRQLDQAGKPTIRIPITSPLAGVVLEKYVQEGQYVNVGDPLFSVADLSRVWVDLDVQEDDFPFVSVGQMVAIESRAYPGENFLGQLTYIYPTMAPRSRTIRVRVVLDNPGLRLKPEMTVTGRIMNSLEPSLVVPIGAVMDSGRQQAVWVEDKPGVFVPRVVRLGVRAGAFVQVRSGLKKGEKVAASGGYLVDSEAQVGAHGWQAPQPESVPPPAPAGTPGKSPPPPRNTGSKGMESMKGMEGMKGMEHR